MSLSPQWLDELRARISLSSVIGRTTRLTKAGHEFKACCPFHNEKSPSFTVNDAKGFYHCFGCGAHGDAIRWMTDQRGLSFMDAVKELASEASLEVPAPDPRAAQAAEQRDGLHDVMAAAQAWFVERLASSEGEKARAYLATRGFDAHTVQRFGFGYAPEGRQSLKAALRQFPEATLVEAGLLISVDDREPYDRFRGRLMLPIEDARGRVVAFGGRILDAAKTDAPKYLNSPDTPLFDKGSTLYNLHRAGPASRQSGRLVVVEGYMDVIALASAGIGDSVAPLGTALTERQIELLWRLVETPVLCFDGDAAGQKAAMRALVRALPQLRPAHSLRIVQLPTKMDPDDVIKEAGAEGLELLLAEAFTLLEFLWLYERNAEAFGTPEEKVGLKARMLRHIDTIQDPDIRRLYRDEIYEKFGDATRKSRREKREHSPEDPHYLAQKKKLKFIYTSEPEVSKKYFHNRLGCAIARSFVLWPDFLPIHAEKLALVKDVDSRIDAMLDALPEGSNLNTADIQLLIHRKGLDQPHPNEFGDLHFPFAHPFFETSRARECLDEAVTLYSDVQRARQSLKAAQARYENDLSKEYEEEKLRLQKVVRSLENKEKKMAKEYAFAN